MAHVLVERVQAAAPAPKWADLRKRALSAAILGPLALACIWFGAEAWTVLISAVAAGLALEWVHLCGHRLLTPLGLLVPLTVFASGAMVLATQDAVALLLLLTGFGVIWAAARGEVRMPAALAAGVLYVGLPAIALIWLREDGAAGRINVLFLVLVVWASDIGAYVAGRLVGGPRLAPRISPAKTWAGAAGGLLAAVWAGWAAARLLGTGADAHSLRIIAVAACLGVVSQVGDLLESFIKRRFGVKDSSRLIPGHGGLLDRLDGVLTAAPAAALLAMALGRGELLWR